MKKIVVLICLITCIACVKAQVNHFLIGVWSYSYDGASSNYHAGIQTNIGNSAEFISPFKEYNFNTIQVEFQLMPSYLPNNYIVIDEPHLIHYFDIGRYFTDIKEYNPNLLRLANLLPTHAGDTALGYPGVGELNAYSEYVENYINTTEGEMWQGIYVVVRRDQRHRTSSPTSPCGT